MRVGGGRDHRLIDRSVARGSAERKAVETVAQNLGVWRETVRSQLRAVLAKTGAPREIDFVELLAGALPE